MKRIQQFTVVEGLVADDIDLLDPGGLAFRDLDGDRHAVVGQGIHLGIDLDSVLATGIILAREFLL